MAACRSRASVGYVGAHALMLASFCWCACAFGAAHGEPFYSQHADLTPKISLPLSLYYYTPSRVASGGEGSRHRHVRGSRSVSTPPLSLPSAECRWRQGLRVRDAADVPPPPPSCVSLAVSDPCTSHPAAAGSRRHQTQHRRRLAGPQTPAPRWPGALDNPFRQSSSSSG